MSNVSDHQPKNINYADNLSLSLLEGGGRMPWLHLVSPALAAPVLEASPAPPACFSHTDQSGKRAAGFRNLGC